MMPRRDSISKPTIQTPRRSHRHAYNMPVLSDARITENLAMNTYSVKVLQSFFLRTFRTWDYMHQQMDFLTPNIEYFPED
jgi:hypothetical protein